MALTTTVAGASSNSYISVADADTYMATTPRAADWAAIGNDAAQEAALRDAMLFLESLAWIGYRSTQTQALEWPRLGGRNAMWPIVSSNSGLGIVDLRGRSWLVTAIPAPIKHAQCEMALAISLDTSWTQDIDDVESVRTGVVTLRSRAGTSRRNLPSVVRQLLDGFLIVNGAAVRLMKA
jgi:hypothetical protein